MGWTGLTIILTIISLVSCGQIGQGCIISLWFRRRYMLSDIEPGGGALQVTQHADTPSQDVCGSKEMTCGQR